MRNVLYISVLFVFGIFGGCALKERTIEPLPRTFLEDVDISAKKDNLPFDHAWVRPKKNRPYLTAVYFKPVRINTLPREMWQRSASVFVTSEQTYMEKAKEVASYFHQELINKTRGYGKSKGLYKVATQPGPNTIIIETALTELELSHPVARAGSLAAPVPGTGAAIAAVSDPHVTFAARLIDGRTGELIATAADRKFAPARVLDLNKLTVSSSAREIVALWADSFGEALQENGLSTVDEKRIELLPW